MWREETECFETAEAAAQAQAAAEEDKDDEEEEAAAARRASEAVTDENIFFIIFIDSTLQSSAFKAIKRRVFSYLFSSHTRETQNKRKSGGRTISSLAANYKLQITKYRKKGMEKEN